MSKGFGFQPGGDDPEFQPFPVSPAPATSGLAIASLIFGVLSYVICFVGLLMAPVAILTGHLARANIRRAGGRVSGGGMAMAGLVLGYVCLALNVALLGYFFMIRTPSSRVRTPGETALSKAESQIISDRKGFAFGNTDEARGVAQSFATTMEKLHNEAFTETNARIKLSGGHYVTWCELRPGRCALVVHVPEYRRFDSDAKKVLEEFAWAAAQKSAASVMKPGGQLAVGLKGVVLYGAVMVGEVSPPGDKPGGPRRKDKERSLLLSFFGDNASPTPEAAGRLPGPVAPATAEPDESPASP